MGSPDRSTARTAAGMATGSVSGSLFLSFFWMGPPHPNPNDHRREARGLKSSRLGLSWARLGPPELTLGRANRHPWAVSNDSRCHQSSANTYDGTDQMDRRRPQLDGWITAPSHPICRHHIIISFAFETHWILTSPKSLRLTCI